MAVGIGARDRVSRLLLQQAGWCSDPSLGSPLYGHLLTEAAADVERGGVIAKLLEPHASDTEGSALPLRMMGAVHRLVLDGRGAALEPHYPSVGGSPDMGLVWDAFRSVVEDRFEDLVELVRRPVQTNEVARSCALIGAFLHLAGVRGKPLRLFEVGASAGLNLLWDRYRYDGVESSWGNPHSPVVFKDIFQEVDPPFERTVEVVERAGCDINPLDPRDRDDQLTLKSYIWADQAARFERVSKALEVAEREASIPIERASADVWTARSFQPVSGAMTVLFHSIVVQYLDDDERDRFDAAIEAAGAAATVDAPVAHVAFEPRFQNGQLAGIFTTVRTWPGGESLVVARAYAQGARVWWLIPDQRSA